MKRIELELNGAFLIEIEQLKDSRGFFGRTWCSREFAEFGTSRNMEQASISFNILSGTLRGMHYAILPAVESKLVRCTMGSIYDVVVDLRHDSPTYLQHKGVVLSSQNHTSIFIPAGFAHGFLTLENNTEVLYMMDDYYKPNCGRGFRWDDPVFNIKWPGDIKVIDERDKKYLDFNPM